MKNIFVLLFTTIIGCNCSIQTISYFGWEIS